MQIDSQGLGEDDTLCRPLVVVCFLYVFNGIFESKETIFTLFFGRQLLLSMNQYEQNFIVAIKFA
jgi:hypothetical protein